MNKVEKPVTEPRLKNRPELKTEISNKQKVENSSSDDIAKVVGVTSSDGFFVSAKRGNFQSKPGKLKIPTNFASRKK